MDQRSNMDRSINNFETKIPQFEEELKKIRDDYADKYESKMKRELE